MSVEPRQSRSVTLDLIVERLRATGWREVEPGQWLPKGVRKHRQAGRNAYYSPFAAIQRQAGWEYADSQRAERQRLDGTACPACGEPRTDHIGPPSPPRPRGHLGGDGTKGSCLVRGKGRVEHA